MPSCQTPSTSSWRSSHKSPCGWNEQYEINTRIGWYSDAVSGSTAEIAVAGSGSLQADGGWNAATPFPFIQGTDCCGEVIEVGAGETMNSWETCPGSCLYASTRI